MKESEWLHCRCGSWEVQAMLIATPSGRGVLTSCKKCGFRVEYRRVGDQVREFVHIRNKGETMMGTTTMTITSSVIHTASFDSDRNVMRIDFKNGMSYEYAVDPEASEKPDIRQLYITLINSESAGNFFSKYIRPRSSKLIATKVTKEETK